MTGQITVSYEQLLSAPRFGPYLDASGNDEEKAWNLYIWANGLEGALHSQIGLFEVVVRNAMDKALRRINTDAGLTPDWTTAYNAADAIYQVLHTKPLAAARTSATQASQGRLTNHPRHGHTVNHDDVVAQLMFGTWVQLLKPLGGNSDAIKQKALWAAGLSRAFPGADQTDSGRISIGNRLNRIRKLRNRVAHHENLLNVQAEHRLTDILVASKAINPAYPNFVAAGSNVRKQANRDPRLQYV